MTMSEQNVMSSATPLVSVLIPTYNRADFILEAIDSVLAQDYPAVEILVVDDGSTDNTAELLQPYVESGRIRFFQQPNQGQSVARNLALKESRGEFICFLDSDNRWLPGKLKRELEVFAQYPDTDIVYGDDIQIDEQGREISRRNMRRYSGRITPYLFRDNCVSMNTTMVRRRCFDEMGGLEVGRRAADDYELWLRFSARYTFRYVPEFFAEYRVMADQISSNKDRRFASNEQILRNFQQRFPEAMSPAEFRRGWSHFFTRKGRHYASIGNRAQALKDYGRALAAWPLHRAPWRALAKLALAGR